MKMRESLRQQILKQPPKSPEEKARCLRAAQRYKEMHSGDPFYAGRSDNFWRTYQSSRVLVNP
jgi:hypothetical protein